MNSDIYNPMHINLDVFFQDRVNAENEKYKYYYENEDDYYHYQDQPRQAPQAPQAIQKVPPEAIFRDNLNKYIYDAGDNAYTLAFEYTEDKRTLLDVKQFVEYTFRSLEIPELINEFNSTQDINKKNQIITKICRLYSYYNPHDPTYNPDPPAGKPKKRRVQTNKKKRKHKKKYSKKQK